MKIALITCFPKETGLGRYAFEIYKNLKDKIEIDYFSPVPIKDARTKIIKEWDLPIYKKTLNYYFQYPKFFKNINNYDLYHITNEMMSRIAKYKRPSIITVADIEILTFGGIVPFLTRELGSRVLKYLQSAEKILSISEDTKKDLVNILGVDSDKVVVTLLGVDHKRYKKRDMMSCREKLKLPKDKKIVLHIGSEEPRRNVSTILKAFKNLLKEHPDTLLVRVGSKWDYITKMIDRMDLSSNIIRPGRVDEDLLPLYYSAADVYVCLDIHTGFGLPCLESEASGIPVVSSREGAFPEVVEHEKTGFLVNPTDSKATAKYLKMILGDSKLRSRLSKKAFNKAKSFSWKRCAQKTLRVYESVVS